MPIGDPGREQFRRAIVTLRNLHIAAALSPLFTLRAELLANDELSDRGGFDDPTRDHLVRLLVHCDRWRRRVTHNPEEQDLGDPDRAGPGYRRRTVAGGHAVRRG